MSATRNDKVGGLRGALQRAELLDFMMRLAKQFAISVKKSSKAKISEGLQGFFGAYISPVIGQSRLLELRTRIRESSRLNELLFDNNKGLKKLY